MTKPLNVRDGILKLAEIVKEDTSIMERGLNDEACMLMDCICQAWIDYKRNHREGNPRFN